MRLPKVSMMNYFLNLISVIFSYEKNERHLKVSGTLRRFVAQSSYFALNTFDPFSGYHRSYSTSSIYKEKAKNGFTATFTSIEACFKLVKEAKQLESEFLKWRTQLLAKSSLSDKDRVILEKEKQLNFPEHVRTLMEGKATGIYMIKNKITKKSYIGKSTDIFIRVKSYNSKGFISRNKSSNIYRKLLKFGLSNFEFHIIEFCPKADLAMREQFFIDKFKPQYNIRKFVHNIEKR